MDPRVYTAITAGIVFVLATLCFLVYRQFDTEHGREEDLAARLLVYSLWTLALLGAYSGSVMLWIEAVGEAWLEVLQFVRFALTTVVAIMLITVLAYWLRKMRKHE